MRTLEVNSVLPDFIRIKKKQDQYNNNPLHTMFDLQKTDLLTQKVNKDKNKHEMTLFKQFS